MILSSLSSAHLMFLFATGGMVGTSDIPTFGSESWRAQFAVDVAEAKLDPVPVPRPDTATKYTVTYKGEIAGIKVGRIFLDALISDDGYEVGYRMEQKGVARWFSDAEAKTTARGTVKDGEIASHYYFNHDYERDDDQQFVELYRPDGERRLRLWAQPAYTFHQAVPEEVALGAVDPMGALIALGFLPNVDPEKSPCDRVVKVFDGRRRFDLVMKDNGTEWIRKGGKGRYQGDSYKCKLEQVKVAGYREKDRGDIEGDLWVYLADVPEAFRTETFAYVPVMIRARQGIFTARLEGKYPIITAPDGRTVNLGAGKKKRRSR